jgi:hypothetical protein
MHTAPLEQRLWAHNATPPPSIPKIWGFHVRDYEECRLLECVAVWFLWESTIRRNLSPPSSGRKKSAFLALWFFSPWWWRRHDPSKHLFSEEQHGNISQKTAFCSHQYDRWDLPDWRLAVLTGFDSSRIEQILLLVMSKMSVRPTHLPYAISSISSVPTRRVAGAWNYVPHDLSTLSRLLVRKLEGKRRMWMDNIKMDLLEIGLNVVD